ncbi:hypothetical protein JIG36_40505 [Actinoplanes sp. LDG1-06]|uniref:Uncharacterized protein n=1 Tax=Paractinoplanes ovalisporus TaxID=2810368 RepID=A0ABS2APV4_9ACTN|nr:UPF0158 family protein [Actinoplanes ovalisporus]MBM2621805.1 hypothetical protein [Actinoplanes ovalisporus]
MLRIDQVDLEMLAMALQDQSAYEMRQLVDSRTGELALWTPDGGLDGENRVDLDDRDPNLILIDPLPSRVWFRDMADFARAVSDQHASDRLVRALDGRGAFRRFNNEIHQRFPELVPAWRAFRDNRAARRAVDWLSDNGLVDEKEAMDFLESHPDPAVP